MAATRPDASRFSRAAMAGSSIDSPHFVETSARVAMTPRIGGVSYSRDERRALCALLDKTGPDAPTLCEGWTTGDLAAHLVLREHRPDAAAGVVGGPLAGYTARVQQRLRNRFPFPDLVRIIRSGPPTLSVMALPGMDERVNAVECFVHHEDVRRATPGWEPRELGSGESDMLWHRLRMARFMLRK